ncbi:hypothetical protein NCCP2165_20830 [Halomonas sp. NCCP-2165]|nr:hypothetical protein NCCP2165_20830 [Halomonas sp. NCCP-2165]
MPDGWWSWPTESATYETREAMTQRAVDNLRQALRGERPDDLVNAAAWGRE